MGLIREELVLVLKGKREEDPIPRFLGFVCVREVRRNQLACPLPEVWGIEVLDGGSVEDEVSICQLVGDFRQDGCGFREGSEREAKLKIPHSGVPSLGGDVAQEDEGVADFLERGGGRCAILGLSARAALAEQREVSRVGLHGCGE